MNQYPLRVNSNSQASSGIQTPWTSGASKFEPIEVSIPFEFDGPNTAFSPEDLFSMALVNCFTATFKVIAERSRVEFEALHGDCELTIDHSRKDRGLVCVIDAHFKFQLSGTRDVEKAKRLLDQVSRQCILINSIRGETHFAFEVS